MTVEVIDGIEIDYSDLEAKYEVTKNESFDNLVILDHLPKIDRTKEEKLLAVIKKNIFTPAKAAFIPNSICMPRDAATDMSKGYMFVEFETAEQAAAVLNIANGYRLDKQHVLSAVCMSDFDRLLSLSEDYQEPTIEPFVEREYLKSWLNDPAARSQFVTLAGTTASVFWSPRGASPAEMVHTRNNWTESYVQWSPRGSYLASLHAKGVMLWGGASFGCLGKFPHANVKLVSFAHNETLMVTWSPFDARMPTEPNLLIWDVLAGKLVRGFVVSEEEAGGSTANSAKWPMIKFSHDDVYACRAHDGGLNIYEVPSFSLLEKKAHKVEGLKDFSWSPVDHSMVFWTIGTEDIPSRVSLMSVPSRLVARTKNLFNVINCQVHWQTEGNYLCVQVERHGKNKKQLLSNIELFRLREKGIPIDCLEFKEPLTAFAWEPEGDRFLAAWNGEFKTTVAFYTMKAQENGLSVVKPLGQQERKLLSRFLWSPRGDFVLLMGTDSTVSTLEFFNVNEMTTMANREHFLATDAAWDPSGRFVVSYVSFWKHSGDNGYLLWDLRGEQVGRLNMPRMALFSWRPRPPTLLSKDRQKEIRKNLKNYALRFEEADLNELSKETSNTAELKSRVMRLWNEWRRHCRRDYETRNAKRKTIIGRELEYEDDSSKTAFVEEWLEDEVEATQEYLD